MVVKNRYSAQQKYWKYRCAGNAGGTAETNWRQCINTAASEAGSAASDRESISSNRCHVATASAQWVDVPAATAESSAEPRVCECSKQTSAAFCAGVEYAPAWKYSQIPKGRIICGRQEKLQPSFPVRSFWESQWSFRDAIQS